MAVHHVDMDIVGAGLVDGGDLGPEGLAFVPAVRSPSKRPLLIVGNEVSGTTAIFEVELR